MQRNYWQSPTGRAFVRAVLKRIVASFVEKFTLKIECSRDE